MNRSQAPHTRAFDEAPTRVQHDQRRPCQHDVIDDEPVGLDERDELVLCEHVERRRDDIHHHAGGGERDGQREQRLERREPRRNQADEQGERHIQKRARELVDVDVAAQPESDECEDEHERNVDRDERC